MCTEPAPPADSPKEKRPLYIYYCAPISHPACTKLKVALGNAQNLGHTHVTLLMSSEGGLAYDGFALHAFIRSLSLQITVHNLSNVDSIAIAPYLACSCRLANPWASFLIHDFSFGQPQPVMARSQIEDHSLMFAAWRLKLKSLLKAHTQITDATLSSLQLVDKAHIMGAPDALKEGIVHSIEEAKVPFGAEIFTIEF